ncbi:hypothetical protein [Citrobacter braakii]|uniref:hypothetical protein n=1 Tax=Citrobacter braakii TaxID=57706 RepID=UPI00117737EA|nr:hypothetical protein [Citrobacter braakii]QXC16817.1 hypothetical protein I6L51_01500 [Citrobacter braakii]
MNKNTVKRSCTAGFPDFLPRQKDPKNQAQQKENMWPEINPWNVLFSVLGVCGTAITETLSNKKIMITMLYIIMTLNNMSLNMNHTTHTMTELPFWQFSISYFFIKLFPFVTTAFAAAPAALGPASAAL